MNAIKAWFKNLFIRKREYLVHTIEMIITINYVNQYRSISHTEDDVRFRVHLFESNKGKRRYEVFCTSSRCDAAGIVKKQAEFHDVIYPWLHGRYVEGIPHYTQVAAEDLMKKLGEQ